MTRLRCTRGWVDGAITIVGPSSWVSRKVCAKALPKSIPMRPMRNVLWSRRSRQASLAELP